MDQLLPWIGIGLAVLGVITIAALMYARRSGLLSAAIERQLIELRVQMAAERLEQTEQQKERLQQQREELQAQWKATAQLESKLIQYTEGMGRSFDGLSMDLKQRLGEVSQCVAALGERIQSLDRLSPHISQFHTLADQLNDLSKKFEAMESRLNNDGAVLNHEITSLSRAVEALNKTPVQNSPGDFARLEDKAEAEVLALAESVAVLRPLVPYPRWRYDADWNNPDVAFRLRQRIWQYFNDRRKEAPFITAWHRGSRICIYLGNDQSRQILVAGCLDPNELAFVDRFLRPGMTFVDIGANDGLYTTLAAKCVGSHGTVWAFEPSSRELSRLERNLELNHLTVRVFPLALADSNGTSDLRVAPYGHEGLNTLGSFVHEVDPGGNQKVQLARLDDILQENPLPHLDFIKMDVEGAELRVLKGAAAALARYRPVVMFEVSDAALREQGGSAGDLAAFLRAQNYDLYMFDPSSGLPAKAVDGIYTENMIGVPAGMTLPEQVYSQWPGK